MTRSTFRYQWRLRTTRPSKSLIALYSTQQTHTRCSSSGYDPANRRKEYQGPRRNERTNWTANSNLRTIYYSFFSRFRRTTESGHWRYKRCWYQPHRYACKYILLASTRIELYSIPQHNIGTPTDAHRIVTKWGEGRLLLDLGSCRLWIPNGSLPCSPINWHALVMQNTTIVWLSINLMWNLSSKVYARKIWNLLGLLFSPQLTHPSTCIIPLLCDCLSIWCAIWTTKCLQICHLRVLPFPPR